MPSTASIPPSDDSWELAEHRRELLQWRLNVIPFLHGDERSLCTLLTKVSTNQILALFKLILPVAKSDIQPLRFGIQPPRLQQVALTKETKSSLLYFAVMKMQSALPAFGVDGLWIRLGPLTKTMEAISDHPLDYAEMTHGKGRWRNGGTCMNCNLLTRTSCMTHDLGTLAAFNGNAVWGVCYYIVQLWLDFPDNRRPYAVGGMSNFTLLVFKGAAWSVTISNVTFLSVNVSSSLLSAWSAPIYTFNKIAEAFRGGTFVDSTKETVLNIQTIIYALSAKEPRAIVNIANGKRDSKFFTSFVLMRIKDVKQDSLIQIENRKSRMAIGTRALDPGAYLAKNVEILQIICLLGKIWWETGLLSLGPLYTTVQIGARRSLYRINMWKLLGNSMEIWQ